MMRKLAWAWAVAFSAMSVITACGSDASGGEIAAAGTTVVPMLCNGVACGINQVCSSADATGICVTICTTDGECGTDKCCSGRCASVTADALNCGACGAPCPSGQACNAGACVTPPLKCSGTVAQLPPVYSGGNDSDAGAEDDAGATDNSNVPTASPIGANGCAENEQCVNGASGSPVCQCGTGVTCRGGERCSAGGACQCGGGAGCSPSEACCGDSCADLNYDENNCGACGKTCPTGTECSAAQCVCPNADQTACDDGCFDLKQDEANCGTCGNNCATGATCELGECKCATGFIDCNGTCVDASDDAHCGACGTSCSGESTCDERVTGSGTFECMCPNFFDIPCGDLCVDPTTDANCGGCGITCGGPTSCKDSMIASNDYTCECPITGETLCGDTCVDLSKGQADSEDPNVVVDCGSCSGSTHPEATCLSGESCDSGNCTCPNANELFCDENAAGAKDGVWGCVTATTTKNCFDCGALCVGKSVCDGTSKGCLCVNDAMQPDANKLYCANGCVDYKTDENNCGACGFKCPGGSTCTAGECSCPTAGQDYCDPQADGSYSCINTAADENNCGACGIKCAMGEECCGSACHVTDWFDTVSNCGACGTVCAPGPFGALFQPADCLAPDSDSPDYRCNY
jgi:hypothetical protein